mmetsp:Transcript_23945/g.26213  ORF Transcript_23945/g.26213 Transcript_23945/m.26213 type:complete len:138 (+) Transcript_23945:276-689(+)|eukprot:gene14735-16356_t
MAELFNFHFLPNFIAKFESKLSPTCLAHELIREGNTFLKERQFNQAINNFKDALRIIDFGDKWKDTTLPCKEKFSTKEVNDVVLPALYGLAESNFHLQQPEKTLFYCEQLLKIQPRAKKAIDLKCRSDDSIKVGQKQ